MKNNLEKYIDLHVHLDGSITVDIAKKLAELQDIQLDAEEDAELRKMLTVPEDCRSLNEFLKCFDLPCSLMQTYEGLKEASYLVAEEMKARGIIYGELRYAPQLHTLQGMTQKDAIDAVLEGISESEVKLNVILCCMRGADNDAQNMETVELAKQYLVEDGGVVALDIAGAEALFPTENYRELFVKASEYGIPFTIHAGEADGAESVRLAIEYGAKRIGHGVRSIEDEDVLRQLVEKGIYLEMCPTSNRQTQAVSDMTKYPIMDFLDRGIKVTVNTDDPAIEGTTIGDEYKYIENSFGCSEEQRRMFISNAIDAAFTSESVKNQLRKTLLIDAD